MLELRTERLICRNALPDDLHDLHAVYSDPHAMRYWSTGPDRDLETTQKRLDDMIHAEFGGYFVLQLDDQVIGTAGRHDGTEIGYILAPSHWRKGLITEALKSIIPYLFQQFDLPELTADIDPRNEASRRVLERLGFTKTHEAKNTICLDGEWCDSVYFALTSAAYQRPS